MLLKYLNVQPNGSKNESKQFDNLWLASLIGSVIPVVTLFLVHILIPDSSQTDKLITENEESATHGSIYDLYLRRKYVNLERQSRKDEKAALR